MIIDTEHSIKDKVFIIHKNKATEFTVSSIRYKKDGNGEKLEIGIKLEGMKNLIYKNKEDIHKTKEDLIKSL